MKIYTIDRKQLLLETPENVWSFFSDPHNLSKLTPPSLNLVVSGETPHQIHSGMIITYRIRAIAGIPANWVTEISHVINQRLFVDEQRFGPYRFWHHQHHFLETDNGIEVRDLVHYSLPLGPLGRFVHAVLVKARLKEIFDYRVDAIETTFRSNV
jgi:ligand-binding SRPBCC domain-containing protein